MSTNAAGGSLTPGSRLGPYEVVSLLGTGGMGAVYRARDSKLQRDVALKVLLPTVANDADRLARFAREARVLASLNHPNIAHLYGFEESADTPALVMELVEGSTLADRIARGPIPLAEALPIAKQITAALEAAHEQHIIHRDLKPANVKLRPDGTVKLLDFGLAKAIETAASGTPDAVTVGAGVHSPIATHSGTIVGTLAYMSPEQATGKPVDKRTDVWSFGCLLYEMLTGDRAFGDHDSVRTITAVLTTEPDWTRLPALLPPIVRSFLQCALEKDPTKRLRDIADMRLALDGAFDTTAADSPIAPLQSDNQRAWRSALWVAAALAACVLTGVVVWRLSPDRTTSTMSFFIEPPRGTEFGPATMQPYPALSADGRRLAFVAPWGARAVIWVQTLGDTSAQPLKGTGGAEFPFWSPDGAFVAFNDDSHTLQKIATSGEGATQQLCACAANFGGSWSRDGTIVFGSPDGISRIPASGGAPTAVTKVDQSRGEFSHRYPVLLPDGRRFLYLIRSTDPAHRGLFLGSIDDPQLKRRIVPDDANGGVGVGPDGRSYLFFVRDLALLAQPFDLQRGGLAGDPLVVARPVIPGEGGRLAPFAVSGRVLSYRHSTTPQAELVLADRRGAPVSVVPLRDGEHVPPTISPDNKLVTSRRDPSSGKRDLWVIDTVRHLSEQVTRDAMSALNPLWTPDGRTLIFASARTGHWAIYSRSADGTGADTTVWAGMRTNDLGAFPTPYPSDITRDGQWLLFEDAAEIFALNLDRTTQPVRVIEMGNYGRVSPDQRWLAYSAGTGTDRQVYLTEFPKPGQRWRVSRAGGIDPQWRPDGRELFYIDNESMLTGVSVTGLPPVFGDPRPLFRISSPPVVPPGRRYSVSPDGQRFAVLNYLRAEQRRLAITINWTLDAGGSATAP